MSVPKLRFKGFSERWASKKLDEITSYVDYRGKTPEKSDSGVFLVTAKNIRQGFIDYETSQEYIPVETYEEVMRRGKPLIGEVLITTEAPLGYVASVDREGIALAQRVIKLRGLEGIIENGFLKFHLVSDNFQKELFEKATGGTVKGIKGSVLHKMKLHFPVISEQTKIANFLTAVDEKITQLTKKCDLLAQYKKGVMQQIFSQKLRFQDENGRDFPEWEENVIGDVLTIGSGKDYKHLSPGNVPVYGTGGYMLSVNDYLYDGESVCIGRKGTIDKPVLLSGKFWTVDTLFYTHSFKFVLPKFIYAYFQMINWKNYNEASGVPSLSKSTIEKIDITIPTIEEQTKIANFLTAIDDKLTNAQTQLAAVKQYKQGLLQQMFV